MRHYAFSRCCIFTILLWWTWETGAYPCDGRNYPRDNNVHNGYCKDMTQEWHGTWAPGGGCDSPGVVKWGGDCPCEVVGEGCPPPFSDLPCCRCLWCLRTYTACTVDYSDSSRQPIPHSCGCDDYRTCSNTQYTCSSNYFFSDNSGRCLPCSTRCVWGYYPTAACTGTRDLNCIICPAGYYCPDGLNAYVCPAGGYCLEEAVYASDCPPGSISNQGQSACSACPSSTYESNNVCTTCTVCMGGLFQTSGCTSWSNTECSSCDGAPTGAGVVWDPTSTTCGKTCDKGYYAYSNASCRPCEFGYYKDFVGGGVCKSCPNFYLPWAPASFEYVPSAITSVSACNDQTQYTIAPCNRSLLTNHSFYSTSCNTIPCTTMPAVLSCLSTVGFYHQCQTGSYNHDGISTTCVSCTADGISSKSCFSGVTPVGQQYCPVRACADTCSAGRFSSAGCFGRDCSSTCQQQCPDLPSNAIWIKNATWQAAMGDPHGMAILCVFTCNSGYMKSGGRCVLCPGTGCGVGQYPQMCKGDGTDVTTSRTCLPCTNKPSSYTGDFAVWLGITGYDGTTQSCTWTCAAGSYYDLVANKCQDCSPSAIQRTTCAYDKYMSAPCATQNGTQTIYACQPCSDTLKPASYAYWWKGSSSPECTWTCNFGYYKTGTSCTAWPELLPCGPFQLLVPGNFEYEMSGVTYANYGPPYCAFYDVPDDSTLRSRYNDVRTACGSSNDGFPMISTSASTRWWASSCQQAQQTFNGLATDLGYDTDHSYQWENYEDALSSCLGGNYVSRGLLLYQYKYYFSESIQCYWDQYYMSQYFHSVRVKTSMSPKYLFRCAAGSYFSSVRNPLCDSPFQNCVSPSELYTTFLCAPCPVGTYLDRANTETSCTRCSIMGNNYFTTYPQSVTCHVPISHQKGVLASTPGFYCNAGYIAGIYTNGPVCLPCRSDNTGSAHMIVLTYTIANTWDNFPYQFAPTTSANLCPVSAFTCEAGYYPCIIAFVCDARYKCTSCPSAPANAILTPLGQVRSDDAMRLDVSCAFTCNIGYTLDAGGGGCHRCASPSPACTPGYEQQLCAIGTNVDTCSVCSGRLSDPNQRWTADCSTACNAGYYYVNATRCMPCGKGTFLGYVSSKQASCDVCGSGMTTEALSAATSCTRCPWTAPRVNDSGVGCTVPLPPCPAGFFLPYGSTTCSPCPIGSFCVSNNSITVCPYYQYYSPSYSTTLSNCTVAMPQCRQNKLGSTTREYVPWQCPTNTFSLAGAESALQCRANAGYWYLPAQTIVGTEAAPICPHDSYCPLSAIQPIPCPSSTPFATQGCANVSCCTNVVPLPCRAGYFTNKTGASVFCVLCPAGFFCTGGLDYPQACDVNATGLYYSSAGSTSGSACYIPALGSTVVCPLNTVGPIYSNGSFAVARTLEQCRGSVGYYYHPQWGGSAILCPAGFYCPVRSAWPLVCTFTPCGLGFYQKAMMHTLCPAGTGNLSAGVCMACNISVNNVNVTYKEAGSCVVCCGVGYYFANGTCVRIPRVCDDASAYTPNSMDPCLQRLPSDFCSAVCDSPQYGLELIWNDTKPCTHVCTKGFYLSGGACMPCGPGTYKSQAGNGSACISCQPNASSVFTRVCSRCGTSALYAPTAGASGCLTCPARAMASNDSTSCLCVPGTYMAADQNACLECGSASLASAWGSITCQFCPPGKSITTFQ